MKQVIELIQIIVVGIHVYILELFVCKETIIPIGNSSARLGDHISISHAVNRYWTQVRVVRDNGDLLG